MSFEFSAVELPGPMLVTRTVHEDDRGLFSEVFKQSVFAANGVVRRVDQVSRCRSRQNVLRGLHYQLNPNAQGKLIEAVGGSVFDVAVDIRRGSPHYGKWVGRVLSADDNAMFWIPEGFAHGYCAMSETVEIAYYSTAEWAPDCERGILWSDPAIGIEWPVHSPVMSAKDEQWPLLENADNNFVLD